MHTLDLGRIGGLGARQRALLVNTALLDEVHTKGADEKSGVAFALGNIAGKLGGVHSFLAGHVLERAPIIAHREKRYGEQCQTDAEETRAAADFELVNDFLQEWHRSKSFEMVFV